MHAYTRTYALKLTCSFIGSASPGDFLTVTTCAPEALSDNDRPLTDSCEIAKQHVIFVMNSNTKEVVKTVVAAWTG